MAFGLSMRSIGVMWPGGRRAPGLVLLAAVFMPAPLWAGDYTLAWRDDARVAAHPGLPVYAPPRVTVNGVALSPFAQMCIGEGQNPRLQGCRAFGEPSRAVVERSLEQAAEEGEDGMLDGLRFLPACRNNASVVIPALREWLV